MAIEMLDWSPDFCLSCDRQSTTGGAYCSQSCRLADLERASCSSNAPSPQTSSSSWTPSNPGNGFYLPPPLNFAAISGRQSSSATSSPSTRSPLSSTPPTSYHSSQSTRSAQYTPSYPQSGRGSLYSSPSRSSLVSLNSSQYSHQQDSVFLSEKAKSELHDYANSFDQTRSYKRRFTVV